MRNADTMVQCTQCDKWHFVFSKKKLNKNMKDQLAELLADIEYTCGLLFCKYILDWYSRWGYPLQSSNGAWQCIINLQSIGLIY